MERCRWISKWHHEIKRIDATYLLISNHYDGIPELNNVVRKGQIKQISVPNEIYCGPY
jgi:hypothetical protein